MDAQNPNKIGLKGDEKNHLRLQRKQHIGGYFEIVYMTNEGGAKEKRKTAILISFLL